MWNGEMTIEKKYGKMTFKKCNAEMILSQWMLNFEVPHSITNHGGNYIKFSIYLETKKGVDRSIIAPMECIGISVNPMESDRIISSPTLQNILVTVNGSSDTHPAVILHLYNQVKGWKTWKFRRKFASNGASTMIKCFVHVQTTPWLHPIITSIGDFRFASFLAALLKLDLWATDIGNPDRMIVSVSTFASY